MKISKKCTHRSTYTSKNSKRQHFTSYVFKYNKYVCEENIYGKNTGCMRKILRLQHIFFLFFISFCSFWYTRDGKNACIFSFIIITIVVVVLVVAVFVRMYEAPISNVCICTHQNARRRPTAVQLKRECTV